ncbi:hypothetical protein Q7C36_014653 [Tachysurus vachellii]|uniref:Uncharacterized protein n=1 Tax=Tachysurus vachellii TaxID=175792 RepID=A0AA88MI41_TACVA|nr:hypothetical protein Q7C36_014653 [Tachysurus vachellii]
MAHFKERTESLLIEADAAATAADMERDGLPDSPALIIQGESMTPSKWMLSVEREVVLGPFSEAFVEGLAALFATYYNLNLAYQDDAACTLEFIQRGLVGINPETGSKVAAGKRDKKMHGMNPHLSSQGQPGAQSQVPKRKSQILIRNSFIHSSSTAYPNYLGWTKTYVREEKATKEAKQKCWLTLGHGALSSMWQGAGPFLPAKGFSPNPTQFPFQTNWGGE